MGKRSVASSAVASCAVLDCGIDVSAGTLAVAVQPQASGSFEQREFANSAAGHRQLIAWLGRWRSPVRVSLEATGIDSLDVALALDGAAGIAVAVLNPRTVHRFAESLRRSKTDAADAVALAEYSRRMRFVAWARPSEAALELRAITRHIATLSEEHARLKNRHHAAEGSASTPRCVREDLRRSIAGIEKRLLRLRRALYMPALSASRSDPHMRAFYTLLLARNKTKMQALTAVARKLLHAIFGIFKTATAWDGAKLFPHLILTS